MTDARDIIERLRTLWSRQAGDSHDQTQKQRMATVAEAADTIASLRKQLEDARGLLDRLCTAYVLVCDDNGTRYYESESSVYAHAKAEALKGKS